MNLHEYQAKELMKKNGASIQEGIVATTPAEAVAAAEQMKTLYNSDWVVVKSQIHAGGRGKGRQCRRFDPGLGRQGRDGARRLETGHRVPESLPG